MVCNVSGVSDFKRFFGKQGDCQLSHNANVCRTVPATPVLFNSGELCRIKEERLPLVRI